MEDWQMMWNSNGKRDSQFRTKNRREKAKKTNYKEMNMEKREQNIRHLIVEKVIGAEYKWKFNPTIKSIRFDCPAKAEINF